MNQNGFSTDPFDIRRGVRQGDPPTITLLVHYLLVSRNGRLFRLKVSR